ncbi:MAG TPA: GNAT family N-acetyltransferase [Thermoanaerobaculia bacterium]|jgi:phosphinothricin acetyltransferase
MPSFDSVADPEIALDAMTPDDWAEVRRIYGEGIATGNATMETEPPLWEAWDKTHRSDCRLVARSGEKVLGWAALSPVSERCVYGGVAEVSVYVSSEAQGRGIGKVLLQRLIRASEDAGIWTLQAGIFPENAASIAIHERCGFRLVGVRERLGKLHGIWRDVALLERRSDRVGVQPAD